jgi:uncharacterized RmlC-like cupin family protein
MRPITRYAKSGEAHITYQVTGEGPLDLVFVPGFVSHLEADWNSPVRSPFIGRLTTKMAHCPIEKDREKS